MIIKTKDLAIGYRRGKQSRIVGSNINTQLKVGKFTALLGSNGAGKSTLIRTLAGLNLPLGGEIYIGDKNLTQWNRRELAHQIAVVLQDPIRSNNLSVFEFAALGRIPHSNWLGTLKENDNLIVTECLQKVGIETLRERKITELSDGEWQKVMLARALAQETPVILLDEPTAHLDLLSKIELVELLRTMAHHSQKTVLMATHDLELALQAADHVWLLDGMGNFYSGIPEDLVLNGLISKQYAREPKRGFDETTGMIRIPPVQKGKPISISGEGIAFFWTCKSLVRSGYQIGGGTLEVRVLSRDQNNEWEVQATDTSYRVYSLEELLNRLESLV